MTFGNGNQKNGWDLPPSHHFNTVLIGKSAFIVQKIGSE